MIRQDFVAENAQIEVSEARIKSINRIENLEDVYCFATKDNGTIIANGIIVSNCDALRYSVASSFRNGELNNPDENLNIDQIRRQIYGDEGLGFMSPSTGGYY